MLSLFIRFCSFLSLSIIVSTQSIGKCRYSFIVVPDNSENLLLNFKDGYEGEKNGWRIISCEINRGKNDLKLDFTVND